MQPTSSKDRYFQSTIQTYHTSVVITDLFFNKVSDIQKNDLQLVGTAAMYIAAKIEEQVPLEVSKFAASTEWKYPPNQILDMEGKIIRVTIIVNEGPEMALESSDHKYVGQQNNAAMGHLLRGK